MRRFIPWIVRLVLLASGLLYLNSAAFSIWVAGGPPNDYPALWLQIGWHHLILAVVLLLTFVVSLFIKIPTRALECKKILARHPKRIVLIFVVIIGAYFAIDIERFFQIDKCLDLGGRWNYNLGKCHGAGAP